MISNILVVQGGDIMDTNMTFRIDSDIKSQMAAICAKLGMTPSTAFNVFANAFVREKGMPFEVKIRDDEKIITKGQMLADTNDFLAGFAEDYKRMAK